MPTNSTTEPVTTAYLYAWDFFGPNAEKTASHFATHLGQFIQTHGLLLLEHEQRSEGTGHWGVYCHVPPESQPLVEKALRPNRKLPAPCKP